MKKEALYWKIVKILGIIAAKVETLSCTYYLKERNCQFVNIVGAVLLNKKKSGEIKFWKILV